MTWPVVLSVWPSARGFPVTDPESPLSVYGPGHADAHSSHHIPPSGRPAVTPDCSPAVPDWFSDPEASGSKYCIDRFNIMYIFF